jgi:uncharacterized protein YbaR (Trm112 family)
MHILLTDVLTCPRCGPRYGLILLADDVRERRVYEGVLGCPNCREQFPIRQGGASLGAAPFLAPHPDEERAQRLAALMGATQGMVLVVGPASADASIIADMLTDAEVIACGWGVSDGVVAEEIPGVSRLGFDGVIMPLTNSKVHGVALTGDASSVLLEEGARVLSPLGRLVLEPAPDGAEERLRSVGFRVLAQDAERIVARAG